MEKESEHNERAIDRLKIFAKYAREELKLVKGFNSFEVHRKGLHFRSPFLFIISILGNYQ